MTDLPLFPKPSDIRDPAPAVRTLRSTGAEQCNMLTKAGRDEYFSRKRKMWDRQGRMCCLHGYIVGCPGKLNWADAMFAHEVPCGHGGGSRDDRIEIDGIWLNGVAHSICNSLQGSRRIPFNAAHNNRNLKEKQMHHCPHGKPTHLPCQRCEREGLLISDADFSVDVTAAIFGPSDPDPEPAAESRDGADHEDTVK